MVSKEGVFDREAAGYEKLFDIKYEFTKGDRLTWHDSAMNHAMVILGVNLDKDGKPNRWRIENSWGKDAGNDGYYVASDSWFDEFVYQVVVDRKYLPKKTSKLYDQEPQSLDPWDPMGTLAD
jgi:bleomycin hydrolase